MDQVAFKNILSILLILFEFSLTVLLHTAKSPVAFLVIDYRLKYLRPSKIREQRRRDVYLAVGELP